MLGASAVVAAGFGIAGGSGSAVLAAAGSRQRTPPTGSVWRSSNGVLSGTLTMRTGTAEVAGNPLPGVSSYNGTFSGPTLVARPGDRLDLTLQNRIDTPSNLHFHGLHVSPRGHSDNVFLDIPPGYDFRYNVQIPADHPSGLYWYHPHRHGYVNAQVYSGLQGLIVIEGGGCGLSSGRPAAPTNPQHPQHWHHEPWGRASFRSYRPDDGHCDGDSGERCISTEHRHASG